MKTPIIGFMVVFVLLHCIFAHLVAAKFITPRRTFMMIKKACRLKYCGGGHSHGVCSKYSESRHDQKFCRLCVKFICKMRKTNSPLGWIHA